MRHQLVGPPPSGLPRRSEACGRGGGGAPPGPPARAQRPGPLRPAFPLSAQRAEPQIPGSVTLGAGGAASAAAAAGRTVDQVRAPRAGPCPRAAGPGSSRRAGLGVAGTGVDFPSHPFVGATDGQGREATGRRAGRAASATRAKQWGGGGGRVRPPG